MLDLVINRDSLQLCYYTLMKGGGASAMLSKKIKAENATIQEKFVPIWPIKSTLENISVNDDARKNHPVSNLFILTEVYIQ